MDRDDEELLARVPAADRRANGLPDPDERALRRRAFENVRAVLGPDLDADALRISPLGPEWSSDIDVHLTSVVPTERLERAGWIRLTSLLERVGIPGQERWAIVADGEVIGACDISYERPPDPVDAVLRRASERGEVRVREVLELRALRRSGRGLPNNAVVRAAAGLESLLGGELLREWSGEHRDGISFPVRVPQRIRARVGNARAAFRPRLIVALSGVDGSGKSSLSRALSEQLTRAGVPHGLVWTRPGMGPLWIGRLAAVGKRIVGQDSTPGMRAAARGDASTLASRRGVVGWSWTMIVTISFLVNVRSQLRRTRGVVIFDRHLLDALVTLDFFYKGVDLRLARLIVRRGLPAAALTVYLDVPADIAVSRKPGDVVGDYAVEQQLAAYATELAQRSDVAIVDGRRPTKALVTEMLELVAEPSFGSRQRP